MAATNAAMSCWCVSPVSTSCRFKAELLSMTTTITRFRTQCEIGPTVGSKGAGHGRRPERVLQQGGVVG